MTLIRLFQTTAFKLSAAYGVVFTLLAVLALLYAGQAVQAILDQELDREIEAEIKSLRAEAPPANLSRLAYLVEARSFRPGASLYLVTDPLGNPVAGNVDWIDDDILATPDSTARLISYTRVNPVAGVAEEHQARVRIFNLGDGFRLLIGRDTGERAAVEEALGMALRLLITGIIVLAIVSWIIFGRGILRRVDRVAAASRTIANGDLSQRLPQDRSGDEFDRLATSLNDILTRLAALQQGLQDVSENIAHDLKTPLTCMRNRLEDLRLTVAGNDGQIALVETSIADCDQLIRVFDSLLMIARMQSGSAEISMDTVNLSEVVRDVVELYEPLAQEAGFQIDTDIDDNAYIRGNRELIGQALANLIDNAIKYAEGEGTRIAVRCQSDDAVMLVSVSDNGPGIPEADRMRVRYRFVRLEPSRGEKAGTGLGLSLVDAVAQLHDGRLDLLDATPGLEARLTFAGYD